MITLTPEESDAYDKGGLSEAVRAFRHRTHLGLIESKRAIEMWLAAGRPKEGVSMSSEAQLMMKLSDANTKRAEAENALYGMKRKVFEAINTVAQMGSELEEPDRGVWYRALGRVDNELRRLVEGV